MVRAWHMAESDADQREPHQLDPPQFVDLDYLKKLGVLYWKVNADDLKGEGLVDKLRNERGFTYDNVVTVSKESLPNYDEKLKMFFTEHMHSCDEIRLAMEGGAYFDVRNKENKWVRIELEQGDLITVPAGIYHRFTLDAKNYIKVMRLFVGEPVWTPIYRPADDHPVRIEYVKNFGQ